MSPSPARPATTPFSALSSPSPVEPVGEIRAGLESLESTLNRLECSIEGLYRDLTPILSVCANECCGDAKEANSTLSPVGNTIRSLDIQARRLESQIDQLRQLVVL